MADIEDVRDALVEAITTLAYPSGVTSSGQGSAIGNIPLAIMSGWPLAAALDQVAAKPGAQVANPMTLVSVYPVPNTSADGHSVMESRPGIISQVVPGIVVSIDSNDVPTFSGVAVGGEIVTLVVNRDAVFQIVCAAGDTGETVAAALARAAASQFSDASWAPGTGTLDIPSAYALGARVSTTGVLGRKTHRQKSQLRVSIWSSNPADRKTVASAIDGSIKAQLRYVMPDTSTAIVTFVTESLLDNFERQGIYRRDLVYAALFDAIEQIAATEVTSVGIQTALPSGATVTSSL